MSLLSKLFGKAPGRVVSLESAGRNFNVSAGETVLESALKAGLAYPHDCTVGTCGTCRTKLISGSVEAITPFSYTLNKEELAEGYILACQALPKSDLVVDVEIASGAPVTATRQAAKLIALDDLTHDIKRARWVVDAPVQYRAGQYMNVSWGGEDHRSYSFAAAPLASGLTEVTTFIRHVPGGRFTDMIFGGDPFTQSYELDAPHGNFWLREGNGPILCIAGGSGLAPLISLLQDAANRRVRRDCILLFGARGLRDLYAAEEIAAIRSAWTASFDYWPILSEEQADGHRHGMVTQFVPEALAKLGSGAHGYMCGPPPMIDAGIHALTEAGIALGDVQYDKFTDASSRS
jgi:p-cymene methyl-monooxygenase electron transfer component